MSEREPEHVNAVTIAVLLTVENERNEECLMLVRDKASQKWGLISGHIEEGETLPEAVGREIKEETELIQGKVSVWFSDYPNFVVHPREGKTSLGIIFNGRLSNYKVPDDGFEVLADGDIDFVKPFTVGELFDLIESPDEIHRPQLNLYQLVKWLMQQYGKRRQFDTERRETIIPQEMFDRFDRLIESGLIPRLSWNVSRSTGEKEYPVFDYLPGFTDLEVSHHIDLGK